MTLCIDGGSKTGTNNYFIVYMEMYSSIVLNIKLFFLLVRQFTAQRSLQSTPSSTSSPYYFNPFSMMFDIFVSGTQSKLTCHQLLFLVVIRRRRSRFRPEGRRRIQTRFTLLAISHNSSTLQVVQWQQQENNHWPRWGLTAAAVGQFSVDFPGWVQPDADVWKGWCKKLSPKNVLICIFQSPDPHSLLHVTRSGLSTALSLPGVVCVLSSVCCVCHVCVCLTVSGCFSTRRGSAGVMFTLTWTDPPSKMHTERENKARRLSLHTAALTCSWKATW